MKTVPFDAATVRSVLLEHFKLSALHPLHPRVRTALNGINWDLLEREAGRLLLRLDAYVWSQKLQDETVTLSVNFPATWWEAFKKRFFPAWALRRWPVQMATVEQEHRFRTVALLPGFRYEQPPRTGPGLVLASLLDSSGRFTP